MATLLIAALALSVIAQFYQPIENAAKELEKFVFAAMVLYLFIAVINLI